MLCISGIATTDDYGNIMGGGGIATQTRAIFEKIGEVLKAAGVSFENVVKTVDCITTTENYLDTAYRAQSYFCKRGYFIRRNMGIVS